MSTIRWTTAQALVRLPAALRAEIDSVACWLFAGVWAIFGQGIVGCP